jgi:hypothetical protein
MDGMFEDSSVAGEALLEAGVSGSEGARVVARDIAW